MLCLACEDEARLVADARELHRPGASYTVETLLAARAQNPTGPLYWVIGSDALVDLPAWHRWRELLDLCHLVVLQRPDADARPAPAYPEQVQRLIAVAGTDAPPRGDFGSIYQLPRSMLAYSASAVRARIAQGAEVAHLLNPRVATYIREHGLYGAASDA